MRRLDHVNFLAADVLADAEFRQHLLGARPTEQIRLDSGKIAARWLTFTDKSYDLVHTEDWTGTSDRLHHIAFAAGTREDILRATPTSPSTPACSSRPARTSTPSSRRSSCTSTSRAAAASSCATR